MSYQVLARKWRPASFDEMVGQEHVLRALVNALDNERLHHAYLFTGTRGVGKTSIARLFAKSLNCEQGVSSKPCGQCAPCREIAEGRFVDLIEVDAASRTKVEDTRELLDNVQYAPTRGRYKVYLIDEVHMLSAHSFNALLKTLEEPPPHIKFLLATTDPQKLPITILSRCLQFNLKNMTPERIHAHLSQVLGQEQVPFDDGALWLLSRSADGSMRDALSLTDQAIAFGSGEVREEGVRSMLGAIDHRLVYHLLEAVGRQDAQGALNAVAALAEHAPDYDGVLAEMLNLLHRVTLCQMLPGSVDNALGDQADLEALAGSLPAEDVQLFYQVALNGRRDLPLVPNPRDGLEMTLMRMLAFRPVREGEVAVPQNQGGSSAHSETIVSKASVSETNVSETAVSEKAVSEKTPPQSGAGPAGGAPSPSRQAQAVDAAVPAGDKAQKTAESSPQGAPRQNLQRPVADLSTQQAGDEAFDGGYDGGDDDPPPWGEPAPPRQAANPADVQRNATPSAGAEVTIPSASVAAARESAVTEEATRPVATERAPFTPPSVPPPPVKKSEPAPDALPDPVAVAQQGDALPEADVELSLDTWVLVLDRLGLSGMTYNIAANCALIDCSPEQLHFEVFSHQAQLLNATHEQRISDALQKYLGREVRLSFETVTTLSRETPAAFQERRRAERMAQAVSALEQDELVQAVIQRFDARLDLHSIQPIDP